MIHKRNHGSKYPSGAIPDIGRITNGPGFIPRSWKISTKNGVNHCRPILANSAVRQTTKQNIVPMQRGWDFETH
jgi:hypothetical protein